MGTELRFGVVGTNFISDWFVEACRRTGGRAHACAVLSRSATTGETFAARHRMAAAFTDFEAMADSVDAVYIASPNGMHHRQALRAISAGKHVLVEKVMAASVAEVAEIFAAAASRGVVAMEATRPLHAPAHEVLHGAMSRVGPIRQVRFAKCQYSSRYDSFRTGEIARAFDPGLGNSALADIGVYVLEPAIDLFGVPRTATGSSVVLHNGFEGAGSMSLGYPDLVVDLSWSKITQGVSPSVILGEDGALTVDDLAEPTRIEFRRRGPGRGYTAGETLFAAPGAEPSDNMHFQIVDFVRQVEAGRTDGRWTAVTRESRRLIDAHLAALPEQ